MPVLAGLVMLLGSTTAGGAAESARNPLAPVDTSSPRATFLAFRDNTEIAYRSWLSRAGAAQTDAQIRRGLRTLDLPDVGEALLFGIGIADALYLYETLSRIDLPPLDSIPDATAVAAQHLTRWSIPGTEITIAKAADGKRAGEFLFTSATVARAHRFYDLVKDRPVQRGPEGVIETWRAAPGDAMPAVLAAEIWRLPRWAFSPISGQPVWKWLAVLLGGLAAVGIAWLTWWLGWTGSAQPKSGLRLAGRSACGGTLRDRGCDRPAGLRGTGGAVSGAARGDRVGDDHGRPLSPARVAGGRSDRRHRSGVNVASRLTYVRVFVHRWSRPNGPPRSISYAMADA